MTAEVLVMNRRGIALAADSVVSCQLGDSSIVRESALKLFMLSKHRPVGVMIYENSSLLGVPWETLIKLFREKLDRRGHAKLTQYGDELIEFLGQNGSLFTEGVEDKYFKQALRVEYEQIKERALRELRDTWVHETGSIEYSTNTCFVEQEITNTTSRWAEKEEANYFLPKKVDDNKTVRQQTAEEIVGRNSGVVAQLIHQVFGDCEIDQKFTSMLQDIALHLVTKDELPEELFSGLVVAGFGEKEHFPSVQHIEIGGIYNGNLKFRAPQVYSVSEDNPSLVLPFAYTEVVDSFLHNVSPSALDLLESAAVYMGNMPMIVLDALKDLPPETKTEVTSRVEQASEETAKEFLKSVLKQASDRQEEVLHSVELLTIKELAQVASTLVSLSSFQQQMSLGRQTVGGPVDVAVISKGDGFIWIERKHYFPPKLNYHFFQKYLDDRSEENISKTTTQVERCDNE